MRVVKGDVPSLDAASASWGRGGLLTGPLAVVAIAGGALYGAKYLDRYNTTITLTAWITRLCREDANLNTTNSDGLTVWEIADGLEENDQILEALEQCAENQADTPSDQ